MNEIRLREHGWALINRAGSGFFFQLPSQLMRNLLQPLVEVFCIKFILF